jgi:hypothetical protein
LFNRTAGFSTGEAEEELTMIAQVTWLTLQNMISPVTTITSNRPDIVHQRPLLLFLSAVKLPSGISVSHVFQYAVSVWLRKSIAGLVNIPSSTWSSFVSHDNISL